MAMLYGLHMDEALKERIIVAAKNSERSLNKEVVYRLRLSLDAEDITTQETAAA